MAEITIRPMRVADWQAVEAIYRAGMAAGNATFEAEPPSWEAFDTTRPADHRLVVVEGDEHSVYVAPEVSGRGVGRALLERLIAATEAAGVWTSGVFPENTVSLALHERCGFRVVGHRERLGRHDGRWLDVVLIERRSIVAGI